LPNWLKSSLRDEFLAIESQQKVPRKSPEYEEERAAMHNPQCCDRRGCARPVIITFAKEALCLDHFCSRSYEFLNGTEALGQARAASSLPTAEQIQTADECARRTLDICMSKIPLNNLERARLLDILLWCGDVVSSLGAKKNSSASMAEPGRHEKSALLAGSSENSIPELVARLP
jgi:hypothetical protein